MHPLPDVPAELRVRQVMSPDPVMVSPGESLQEVIRLMARHRIGGVLVGQNGAVQGIFTERDLLRIAADAPHGWRQQPIADWMTRDPHTIGPDTGWEEAVALMERLHVRHLPVVERGSIIGIVSARQLIARRTDHLNRMVEERTHELQRLTAQLLERDGQTQRNLRVAGRLLNRFLLPGAPAGWPELSWAVHFRPLDPLGGDYYDFAQPDGRHLGVLIADASGHSIPAAMVAIMARLAFAEAGRDSPRPGVVLSAMNRQLQGLTEDRFVSAFYGVFDRVLRRFTYTIAGHTPPLHYAAREHVCRSLEGRGILLGIVPEATYEEQSVSMDPGDRLCLFTDGVTESRNPAGELFGTGRLEAAFAGAQARGADAVLRHIVDELTAFRGERPAGDDETLLVAEVRRGGGAVGW
jgi:serine phosphatase RsbU (regulator of sigma subunit)